MQPFEWIIESNNLKNNNHYQDYLLLTFNNIQVLFIVSKYNGPTFLSSWF